MTSGAVTSEMLAGYTESALGPVRPAAPAGPVTRAAPATRPPLAGPAGPARRPGTG